MHRPMTSDGFALYTKADGYAGTVEGESQAEQSENYRKQLIIHLQTLERYL